MQPSTHNAFAPLHLTDRDVIAVGTACKRCASTARVMAEETVSVFRAFKVSPATNLQ